MRLLQRYILIELFRVFAFVLSVLTVLLVFVGLYGQAKDLGLGPQEILQILPYVVPSLLPFTIPATLLLTVCVVYGRIAADQEITAAKAAGINVLSLLWPAFFLGATLSVVSLLLTDQIIPWSVGNIQRTVTLAMEDIFLERLRSTNQMIDPQHGVAITVIGVEGKTLIGPTFRYAPRGREAVMIQAKEARLEFDVVQQHVMLHLRHCHVNIPGQERAFLHRVDYPFPLSTDAKKPKPRHLTIQQIRADLATVIRRQEEVEQSRAIESAIALALGDFDRFAQPRFQGYANQLEADRSDFARLRTEFHGRFALSCSCFFFVLMGSPFSILQARRQFLTSFLLVFLPILLVYYPLVLLMMNLAKSGTVNPAWAMWVGNVVLLAAAAGVLRKATRH